MIFHDFGICNQATDVLGAVPDVPYQDPAPLPDPEPPEQSTAANAAPTSSPNYAPTTAPAPAPSARPSASPTFKPTAYPTFKPTAYPSFKPSMTPSFKPSALPAPVPPVGLQSPWPSIASTGITATNLVAVLAGSNSETAQCHPQSRASRPRPLILRA